ncbi:MAG TPA: hypothetical protein PKA98_06770, partial [Acidimicrobiales bacterium]|nr:hypothetical protein [Acidimicrobiales bacterium]
DVDVDIPSSGGQLRIYRNKKTPITALFDEPFVGIQNNEKNGTFDIAVLDINGDTWPDLVLGRYAGVSVWIQVPPTPACPPAPSTWCRAAARSASTWWPTRAPTRSRSPARPRRASAS